MIWILVILGFLACLAWMATNCFDDDDPDMDPWNSYN